MCAPLMDATCGSKFVPDCERDREQWEELVQRGEREMGGLYRFGSFLPSPVRAKRSIAVRSNYNKAIYKEIPVNVAGAGTTHDGIGIGPVGMLSWLACILILLVVVALYFDHFFVRVFFASTAAAAAAPNR